MKKYLIFTIVGISLLLGGCQDKITSNIIFDSFELNIKSDQSTYKQTNSIQSGYQQSDIYKIYISDNSGFTNSIIISKQAYNTKVPLDKLRQINIEKIKPKLKGFNSSNSSIIKINCSGDITTGYIENFYFDSINLEKTTYINQLFFQKNNHLYTISTATETKADNKELKAMFNNINCIQ